MEKHKKTNVLFTILGIGYLIALFFPLVKSLIFGSDAHERPTYSDWVEVPLIKEN